MITSQVLVGRQRHGSKVLLIMTSEKRSTWGLDLCHGPWLVGDIETVLPSDRPNAQWARIDRNFMTVRSMNRTGQATALLFTGSLLIVHDFEGAACQPKAPNCGQHFALHLK